MVRSLLAVATLVACATTPTPAPRRKLATSPHGGSPPVAAEPASPPSERCTESFVGAVEHAGSGSGLWGLAREKRTGAGLAGVTVVATSASRPGTHAEITDDTGRYAIADLPPGDYRVTFYYGDSKLERDGVELRSQGATQVNVTIDAGRAAAGEVVSVSLHTICAELHTNCPEMIVDKDYIQNMSAMRRCR